MLKYEQELFYHQQAGVDFLSRRPAAMLADEMGLGKSRQALVAAARLHTRGLAQRVLILCPAAVRYAWGEELGKLVNSGFTPTYVSYSPKDGKLKILTNTPKCLEVCVASYGLMRLDKDTARINHIKNLYNWCVAKDTILICDESSFLKSKDAKQTQGVTEVSQACKYRWLLTGTPVVNSPIDLWSQGVVMGGGKPDGPIKGFKNFYSFRARYFFMSGFKMKEPFIIDEKLPELQQKFKPFVLRREKFDCLDLPPKAWTIREVPLAKETWKIYQELKKEALLALPDKEILPEPNAATRLLRLCQLTSGHVGIGSMAGTNMPFSMEDVSAEKLLWFIKDAFDGELSQQQHLVVWCRWRRERERLAKMISVKDSVEIHELYGGQTEANRSIAISNFQEKGYKRKFFLAQQAAGAYGITLTAAHTAVYMSNDFSYVTRIQSEDRLHRIGQEHAVLYLDVLATGPDGQRTTDHHVRDVLKEKKDLATLTCSAWRRMLEES